MDLSFQDDEIQQTYQDLLDYFSSNSSFRLRKFIGAGANGSAFRMQYLRNRAVERELVVKIANDNQRARQDIVKERDILMRLRGAVHIVQPIDIPGNPLYEALPDDRWLVMEWLPNGELGNFIIGARMSGIDHLPNRLLWRFFLCLVRACCGMAWPMGRTDGSVAFEAPVQGVPEGRLAHNDIHNGNIVIGDWSTTGEHSFAPILKLIDFGNAAEMQSATVARKKNLNSIGDIMMSLIALHTDVDWVTFKFQYQGMTITSSAGAIYPSEEDDPYPWLDDELTDLIALCLVHDNNHVPTLNFLLGKIRNNIGSKDGAWYRVSEEQNDYIRQLCRDIILSAQ
ncbi:hypothetical protein M426DRAFT_25646 [Hypoxylon sp. CI-4A]|nr:hypothetical protein M426DRAFT_25646 [Hypoxylon sp. CI-4A]